MKMNPSSSSASVTLACCFLCLTLPSAGARDRFEYDPTPKAPPAAPSKPKASGPSNSSTAIPSGATVLNVGDVREVFNSASDPDLAFYVPEKGSAIVQVVVEKKFLRKPVYFVKALRQGTITGGLVPRGSLDSSGFRPKNIAEEARIQAALKQRPITISVR